MSIYKITNITNSLGKREFMHNSTVNVEYVDSMIKKIMTLQAGATVYLTVESLPISVHRLRVKNFVTVSEVTEEEMQKSKVAPTIVPVTSDIAEKTEEEQEKTEDVQKTSSKKRTNKKEIQE